MYIYYCIVIPPPGDTRFHVSLYEEQPEGSSQISARVLL